MTGRTRHSDAGACLDRLLDRYEASLVGSDSAAPGERSEGNGARARAISEMVSQSFPSHDSESRFRERILAAEKAGAVRLHMDRGEASHLMKKVELVDPARLYVILSRQPRASLVEDALLRLEAACATSDGDTARIGALISRFADSWAAGRSLHHLSVGDVEAAIEFVRAFAAMTARAPEDLRDLRTYSRQTCGDSKLMERHKGRLIAEARVLGLIPTDLEEREAEALLGLEKFPHLVQVAGALPILGPTSARRRHQGLHPDLLEDIEIPHFEVLLTVENYASFNRHVREAMGLSEIVIYTGGWPGRGETAFIARLAGRARRVLHWGDIDMAGAGIADAVWRAAGRDIGLHMMEPERALARGGSTRGSRPLVLDPASPASPLAVWLAGPEAHTLEQEEIDPAPVA